MARRIRFLSDQVFETQGPGKGPSFKKDSTLGADDVAKALGKDSVTPEYAEGFLDRWLQRGVAIIDDGKSIAGADEGEDKVDLEKLTRAELDDLAKKCGVDVSQARTKADVIEALEAA